MGLYGDDTREAIDYSLEENLITEIPIVNFNLKEAEGFVKKFYPLIHGSEIEEEYIKKGLPYHYKLSNNGHPILFKYLITDEGIEKDIKDKYNRYIFDKKTAREDERKIEAALFSCILDLCGIKITDDLADHCEVDLSLLEDTILKYNEPTGTWETLHPVWNIQFLNFWYSKHINSKHIKHRKKPEKTVKQIVETIVSLKDEEAAYRLIYGLTNIVAYKQELLGLFEPSLEMPEYLDDARKARLYIYLGLIYLGLKESKLQIFEKSLEASTKAVEILGKLAKTDGKFKDELAGAYNNRALTYSKKGDYDSAIKDYERAIELIQDYDIDIKLNPKLAAVYDAKGGAHFDKGDYDSAIKDYERAIELNPEFAQAYKNRGLVYFIKREYDSAIQYFERAIELNPELFAEALNPIYAMTYINKGSAHLNKGEYDQAIQEYGRAIEINPLAEAYYYRGIAYFKNEEYNSAIQDYERAIELNPEFADTLNPIYAKVYAEAYYNRGNTHFDKGDYDSAIKDYDSAIELNPKHSGAYGCRGAAHLGKENYDLYVTDSANAAFAAFLLLIKACKENPELFQYAYDPFQHAFNIDKSEHVIKFEAGVALSAIFKIMLLTGSKELKEKDIEEILSKVKGKEPELCASAKAVLTVLKGGDAEISKEEFKDNEFKDEAFALLLKDLKKLKAQRTRLNDVANGV